MIRQPLQVITIAQFAAQIQQEFCLGSGIAPGLFRAAVEIASDTEVGAAGEVRDPIADALGWPRKQAGFSRRFEQMAALFRQESGDYWQAKLLRPRKGKDDRDIKYETVIGGGGALLPPVDVETWVKVASRFGVQGFLPSWVKQASAAGQSDRVSHSQNQLTKAEFDRYATRLQPILSGLSVADSYSLEVTSCCPTPSRSSPNCNTPLISTEPTSPAILSKNHKQAPSEAAKISSSKSFQIPEGCFPDDGIFQTGIKFTPPTLSQSLKTSKRLEKTTSLTIETSSFWQWVDLLRVLPIVVTEGGKKALSLLSQGYVAIALTGVNGGYRKLPGNEYRLIADVERFATGRSIGLAFDQDEKPQTRRRVMAATLRFGRLLQTAQAAAVRVARWKPSQGKGVDDLIVGCGFSSWEQAETEALPIADWMYWLRLEGKLSGAAIGLKLDTRDLADVDPNLLPESGIIGIASGKGTGKTKLIEVLTRDRACVRSLGHRIALMQNLAYRLGLDYISTLDKVQGRFFSVERNDYSDRVALVVDSLLAIDPAQAQDCDLVIDEVVQVIRHLLMSSTCDKGGKRPVLLARLRQLIRAAKRVIVADADLDTHTLNYIRELRGDDAPVFLVQNVYHTPGYPVEFLDAPDRTAIVAQMLEAIENLPENKILYAATDSKGCSKQLARLIEQNFPGKRVLLINAETSGGELERAFMQQPDVVLAAGGYDVVIASPSVATGVSIQVQGAIESVYGIFTGASSTDADIAQALGRVREPVERVVWCAVVGSNYSRVSRSVRASEVREHLFQQTTALVSLVRSSLREDIYEATQEIDWQADLHLQQYARLAANQNQAMLGLRDALRVRLQFEGCAVQAKQQESNADIKFVLRQTRQEVLEMDAEAIVAAENLELETVLSLEGKEGLSVADQRAVTKFLLADFYGIESAELTIEEVLRDRQGQTRSEIRNLEAQICPDAALDRTLKSLERQYAWGQGFCPWDMPTVLLRRAVREKIGLGAWALKLIEQPETQWSKLDLEAIATAARENAEIVRRVLHFSPSEAISDTQIVHQLLQHMGIRVGLSHWSQAEGKRLRNYGVEIESHAWLSAILDRRRTRRERIEAAVAKSEQPAAARSPLGFSDQNPGGDQAAIAQEWRDPAAAAEVKGWWRDSEGDPEWRSQIVAIVPVAVLEFLGLMSGAT